MLVGLAPKALPRLCKACRGLVVCPASLWELLMHLSQQLCATDVRQMISRILASHGPGQELHRLDAVLLVAAAQQQPRGGAMVWHGPALRAALGAQRCRPKPTWPWPPATAPLILPPGERARMRQWFWRSWALARTPSSVTRLLSPSAADAGARCARAPVPRAGVIGWLPVTATTGDGGP